MRRWLGTIQHGLPVNLFRPAFEPGSYLAFLGRLDCREGAGRRYPHRARRRKGIAHRRQDTARRDRLLQELPSAADRRREDSAVGEVDDAKKQRFLADAVALLFPIDWPEPFGLVMIEAMACGTPVIAYRSGSVPEVVEDGVTGFIVESEEEAVAAVSKVALLDRKMIRQRFEERFSSRRMVREYESRFQKLISGGSLKRSSVLRRVRNVKGLHPWLTTASGT